MPPEGSRMSTPPPSPGPGLRWVEADDAVIKQEIERCLGDLALSILRDDDAGLRVSAARDWARIEVKARETFARQWAAIEARHARTVGQVQ
jgi:hypothetical protein